MSTDAPVRKIIHIPIKKPDEVPQTPQPLEIPKVVAK